MTLPRCGACGTDQVAEHSCIEGRHLLHVVYWLQEGLEDIGHDLGHYARRVMKNVATINAYAKAVADDSSSKLRVELHKKVCVIIGAEHETFKPFESDAIWDLPNYQYAQKLLWNAVIEHLWQYTTLFKTSKLDFRTVWQYRERYLGKHQDLHSVFEESRRE
jgi:hypothetical protein